MSEMKRFTSYKSVSVGQVVHMKWPTEALAIGKTGLKWKAEKVKSVHSNSVVVELENGSLLSVYNLTALYYVS